MVNYKIIADNDPGGDLETAFAAMSAETVTSAPEVMVTYRRISAVVSLAASAELEAAVKSELTIPSWVNTALASDGIDVNDVQVSAVLDTLVSAGTSAEIKAMGVITEPKYKGFKIGHLANARQMREEGRI